MNDQKRNYLPVNQSKLFDVNKRFFDRPVEVKAMLHKADSLGVWPAEGETVRILKRLSEIEDIFWEKRYQKTLPKVCERGLGVIRRIDYFGDGAE
jgi:hypothetical protein